jgi:hypothetical protein
MKLEVFWDVDRRFGDACCLHHQVDIQLTRQYIPEDSELHTRRREDAPLRRRSTTATLP